MRSVVELAENQPSGLLRGDRLIAPGTIPDYLGLLFGLLSFEQMRLTYLLCGNCSFMFGSGTAGLRRSR